MARLSSAAIVLAALSLSGCGWPTAAGRVESRHDEPRLSRPAFVSRVEAACARRARALAALPRPRTKANRRAFFTRIAAIEHAEADTLVSLNPPRPLEREYVRFVAASAELADIADRFVVAVVRDDAHERRRALADAERASAKYDDAAKRLRLPCRQSA